MDKSPASTIQLSNSQIILLFFNLPANKQINKQINSHFFVSLQIKQMEDLPQNFAEQLLDLQSQLDEQCSMELIQQLNQLYRIAIDYYVREEPRKAKHFQKKMTELLANPKILTIIEEPLKKNHSQQNNPHNSNTVKTLKLQTKIKDQVNKFQSFSDHYIKNILETSQRAVKKNLQLKKHDLNRQQKKLEERILLKKFRSQQKLKMLSPRKITIDPNL